MYAEPNERPTVEESYQTASNTSDLSVEADRRTSADVLIAAGWSPSRLGMALLRLHSEWDAAARRRAMSSTDLILLANSLKSRSPVWAQIGPWMAVKGIASEVGAAALLHWLHPTCPHCDGHGLRKVPNAPALSARQCSKCQGTGKRHAPEGSGKLLAHLDYCVSVARGSIARRLRSAA